uniref:Pentatricopeptide repeat-containing protein 2, mitochondrial n=1 Tax=Sphenodon punctatus TaxID=8508 RepID=A0A8D0L0Q8_SPHPU
MATAVRGRVNRLLRQLLTHSLLLSATPAPSCWSCPHGAKRCLLSEDIVRLQQYRQNKMEFGKRIYGRKDPYFKSIEEKLENNIQILRDELKLLLHLCETPDDVELVKKVVYRYHAENRNVNSGRYKFGPLFMRLCYELDLEASAVELIKDQTLHGFFSDSASFNILMDMLFIKGHYERALEVLLEMRKQGVKFNKNTCTLAYAICYKLNSPETFKICTTLLEELQFVGDRLPKKACYFAVAFALVQNDVAKARFFYSHIMNHESRVCTNLNILIQAQSGELEDLINTLETATTVGASEYVKKPKFSNQVLTQIGEKLRKNHALHARFESLYDRLHLLGQVTFLTLDDLLSPTKKQLLSQNQAHQQTCKMLQSALFTEYFQVWLQIMLHTFK